MDCIYCNCESEIIIYSMDTVSCKLVAKYILSLYCLLSTNTHLLSNVIILSLSPVSYAVLILNNDMYLHILQL